MFHATSRLDSCNFGGKTITLFWITKTPLLSLYRRDTILYYNRYICMICWYMSQPKNIWYIKFICRKTITLFWITIGFVSVFSFFCIWICICTNCCYRNPALSTAGHHCVQNLLLETTLKFKGYADSKNNLMLKLNLLLLSEFSRGFKKSVMACHCQRGQYLINACAIFLVGILNLYFWRQAWTFNGLICVDRFLEWFDTKGLSDAALYYKRE